MLTCFLVIDNKSNKMSSQLPCSSEEMNNDKQEKERLQGELKQMVEKYSVLLQRLLERCDQLQKERATNSKKNATNSTKKINAFTKRNFLKNGHHINVLLQWRRVTDYMIHPCKERMNKYIIKYEKINDGKCKLIFLLFVIVL